MAHVLLKPRPGADFYVVWSTVADGPIDWGPRADLVPSSPRQAPPTLREIIRAAADPRAPLRRPWSRPMPEEAFAVADEHGSSTESLQPGWFDYGSEEPLLYIGDEVELDVSREDFPELVDALVEREALRGGELPEEREHLARFDSRPEE